MAKILFHCGAHKTASTHLQQNLQLNNNYLESKGIKYYDLQQDEELLLKIIEFRGNLNKKKYDVNKTVQYIKKRINEKIGGYDLAIISYEGLLGSMSQYDFEMKIITIYPYFKELIIQYKKILEGHDVTPVFVTRNYADFILSSYKWQVRHGRACKLSTYVENFKLDELRWTKIIKTLQDTFSTPIVWTYEVYKKDPNKMLYNFLNLFFESSDDFKELKYFNKKTNVGGSKDTLNLYYAMNKLLDNRFLHTSNNHRFNVNQNFIDKYFGKSRMGKFFPNCLDIDIKDYFDTEEAYKIEVKLIRQNKFCNCLDNITITD